MLAKRTQERDTEVRDLFTINPLINKIESESVKLSDLIKIQRGLEIGKDKTKESNGIPILTGEDVLKYSYGNFKYISKEIYKEYNKGDEFFNGNRLLIRETGAKITCLFVEEFLLSNRSLY